MSIEQIGILAGALTAMIAILTPLVRLNGLLSRLNALLDSLQARTLRCEARLDELEARLSRGEAALAGVRESVFHAHRRLDGHEKSNGRPVPMQSARPKTHHEPKENER